jgi:hypothetical protein
LVSIPRCAPILFTLDCLWSDPVSTLNRSVVLFPTMQATMRLWFRSWND